MSELKKYLSDKGKSFVNIPYLYGLREFNNSVPYSGPYYDDQEIIAAIDCLLSSKWAVAGENVTKFEREFSSLIGLNHSVMVNSGSSANLLMISAIKKIFQWKDDDEIIVSVVGFPTTYSALILNNLKPIFIDIELESLNFDMAMIESKITSRTRAIFVSPVLGNPPNIDRLLYIKEKYQLELILDGCDSFTTRYKGKPIESYFLASSCSFYPAHHISTLQGGMVSSTNESIIKTARSIATWGRGCYCSGAANLLPNGLCGKRFSNWLAKEPELVVDHKYVYPNIGYNLLPLDLQGAIGLEQLKKLSEIHCRRRINKHWMDTLFAKIHGVRLVKEESYSDTSWFGVPLICDDSQTKTRLVSLLEKNKIQTRNYFAGNILLHPAYQNLDDYRKYPLANEVLKRVFFVGCAPFLTQKHFEYIEETLKKF